MPSDNAHCIIGSCDADHLQSMNLQFAHASCLADDVYEQKQKNVSNPLVGPV